MVLALPGDQFPRIRQQRVQSGAELLHPPAAVAKHWIDPDDPRVKTNSEDLTQWWKVFNDPVLNRIILCAYQRNLTLKEAGFRILQARYQLAIAKGELFPQTQTANGSYLRRAVSANPPNAPLVPAVFENSWAANFNLQWQLDFWGQFRRAVQAQEATLEANVANYDAALVTLFADFAQNYLTIRTDQERIKNLRENVKIQKDLVLYTKRRFDAGFRETELDLTRPAHPGIDGGPNSTAGAVNTAIQRCVVRAARHPAGRPAKLHRHRAYPDRAAGRRRGHPGGTSQSPSGHPSG